MLVHETRLRPRYAETDRMGVVYYANYFVWMEVARVEYCRALGFEYSEMESKAGALLAVTEARCRYRAPAHFDEEVVIVCECIEARSRTLRFRYQVLSAASRAVLATGETLHTVINPEGRMIRLPEPYRKYFDLAERP